MPEFQMPLGDKIDDFNSLDPFVQGYIEAMFFTNTGTADDEDLEDVSFADLSPCAVDTIKSECKYWVMKHAQLLAAAYKREGCDEDAAGRDYWYTRNGHGVGYWDREALDADGLGDKLADAARYSERYIYRGDEGKVYYA